MAPAEKTDFKKTRKEFFTAKGEFSLVTLPRVNYLMIDGAGAPESVEFTSALELLYPVAYTLKFQQKALGADFGVPPLEGLWWADDPTAFAENRREEWKWTLMVMVPDSINQSDLEFAKAEVLRKKRLDASAIRLEPFEEGLCVQVMHLGPYSNEGPVLEQLHSIFMPEHNLTFNGHHHEIYLSDARRVEPAKLRTILRQPVTATSSPK